MVKNRLPWGIALAAVLVVLFSAVVIRYAMKTDPTTIERASEKNTTSVGDNRESEVPTYDESKRDSDAVVTAGPQDYSEDGPSQLEEDESAVVTQSTAVTNNRRDGESTTTTTSKKSTTTTTTTTAKAENDKLVKLAAELDTLAKAYNKAADNINNANDELNKANAELDAAQNAFNEAKQAYDNAKKNYDASQADNYKRGAAAFYDNNGSDASGLFNTYTLSGYTHLGEVNDATSLDNTKRAIELLAECNQLRAEDGKSELLVSDRIMALAQLNANAEQETGNGENQTGYAEILAFGFDDPYTAWYYEQKDNDGGHYHVMTNDKNTAMGMGLNSGSAGRGNVHSQLFAEAGELGTLYSVNDYLNRFNNFYNNAIKGKGYDEEEKAYNNASTELENAKKNVITKEATAETANKAYEEAKADYEAKEKEYNEAKDN